MAHCAPVTSVTGRLFGSEFRLVLHHVSGVTAARREPWTDPSTVL